MGILGGGTQKERTTTRISGGLLGREQRKKEEEQKKVAPYLPIIPTAFKQKMDAETKFKPITPKPVEKQLPGRDIPVIGPVLRGLDIAGEAIEPVASVLRQVITPGAGLGTAARGLYGAAGGALERYAPGLERTISGRVAREAIREGAVGAPLAAGQELAITGDVRRAAEAGALGLAGGAVLGGAVPVVGAGIRKLLARNNVPETVADTILALPAPRQRGQRPDVVTPDVITPFGESQLLGLPAPKIGAPTTARVSQRINPYREQFENLVREAQQLQAQGRFTPGREDLDLEQLWAARAPREGVSLDELIQRAYPSQQEITRRAERITPDLTTQAREYQRAREIAGAPLPVRTTAERLTQPQGILGRAAQPVERVGRAPQAEIFPARTQPVRPRVDVTPPAEAQQMPIQSTGPVRVGGLQQLAIPRAAATGKRGFFSNLEQGGLTPEVQARMSASEKRGYEQITNIETVNSANVRIEKLGVDRAEAQLLGKTKFKADDVATGMRLIQQLQVAGNVERAVSVAEKVARELTTAGQTVQAASIWARLSPEGALLAAQRKVNRVNENLLRGQAEVKLSPTQAQEITDAAGTIQAAGGSRERAGTVMEIMDRVNKGETITPQERQLVADFVTDAKRFLKPTDIRPPRPAKPPKEMDDVRVRDRVVSFLDSKEQEALARINARRNRLSSTPLDEWADYAIVLASRMAKGTVKVADLTENLVRDFGEEIRPYFNNIYAKAQEIISQSSKQINDQVISKSERVAESFIKQKGDQLAPNDVALIRDMAQKVSSLADKERRVASQELQSIMQSFEKVGIGRKLSSAQYIAMLLNPLTQIRNVVGNELMYRLERVTKWIGTPIDMATSKITGGPRTISFKSGPSVWDDFFKPAKDYWSSLPEGAVAGARGVSPEGLTSKYEIQGQAFRSKYNPLTYMEKALGAALQGFDYAAYTRVTNQRLSEMAYLDSLNKGIQGDDAIRNHMQTYMTNLDDATHNIAKEYGKFSTLQDDSVLAQKIMGFRRGANILTTGSAEFGAGSLIVPFAKTPANLLLRGLDYSPIGILKALKQTNDMLRNPNTDLTRADVINSVSRALMGTGMGAMAYWMADKGALFGRSNKDPEIRKLMQATGIKDFQINGSALARMLEAVGTGGDVDQAAKLQSGDTLWSYQWAQPSSMPMAIGSNIYQSRKAEQGAIQTAGEAALAGATTLLDSSVLSGIREIFQIPPGEDNVFKAVGMNLLKQLPSQFVPSMARQFNVLFDEKQRETMAMPDDTLGKITNYAESTIPGLAQQMPQRVSTLGVPQTRPNTFFDVFLSPAARSKYQPTPEAQLVIDLLNETGDKSLAPRAVSKYLSGKDVATGIQRRVDLTPEQYVELQTIVGQETAERLKKINPDLPTDRKIEKVIEAFDAAGKIGRNKIKQDVGLKKTR